MSIIPASCGVMLSTQSSKNNVSDSGRSPLCKGLALQSEGQMKQARRNGCAGYADSTVDLIEALELEQPDLLGWSLGGDISLYIAEFYPDMVNRVVVADTTSGGLLGKPLVIATMRALTAAA